MFLLVKVVVGVLIIYFINKAFSTAAKKNGWSFKGSVEKVWYDDKGTQLALNTIFMAPYGIPAISFKLAIPSSNKKRSANYPNQKKL